MTERHSVKIFKVLSFLGTIIFSVLLQVHSGVDALCLLWIRLL